jgi:D-serine deaminase-like pyridoxal phosphate-dependent protein
MQCLLGACTAEQIAVRVLTRVIGHYPAANMLLVDMGWTGTSAQGKEHGYVSTSVSN